MFDELNEIQCTLVIVNAWIVNNLSLVNIFGETGPFFYNINYMLNSEHLSLVNKIGDKTEYTITRVRCTRENSKIVTIWIFQFSDFPSVKSNVLLHWEKKKWKCIFDGPFSKSLDVCTESRPVIPGTLFSYTVKLGIKKLIKQNKLSNRCIIWRETFRKLKD